MKRSFANAILCLAVVAMLAGMAYAQQGGITNLANGAATLGAWTFDSEFGVATTPGQGATAYPATYGAIDNSGSNGLGGTVVGRYYTNATGDDNTSNPANYVNIPATYSAPSTGYGTQPSSLKFGYWGDNEGAPWVQPLTIQGRVDCPSREGMGDWDMKLGTGGTSYTIEAVIKPDNLGSAGRGLDEAGQDHLVGRTDFYEGLVTYARIFRPNNNDSPDWSVGAWYLRTTGSYGGVTGLDFYVGMVNPAAPGSWGYLDVNTGSTDLNLLDGNWHHVAAVITSTGPGTAIGSLYLDNVLVASNAQQRVLADFTLNNNGLAPYEYDANGNLIGPANETQQVLMLGDAFGRWDDQYIGLMDGAAFTRAALAPGLAPVTGNFVLNRVPEPSSIVLLVMGALALLAIRRAR